MEIIKPSPHSREGHWAPPFEQRSVKDFMGILLTKWGNSFFLIMHPAWDK